MPTTPVFDIPYPGPGNQPNVPADMHALAAWLEDFLEGCSGTYTPAAVGELNVASITPRVAAWTRMKDIVTVQGQLNVTASASGEVLVKIPLPIASDFSAASVYTLTGLAVIRSSSAGHTEATRSAGSLNAQSDGLAHLSYAEPTSGGLGVGWGVWYHFAYRVI